ncbi:MAG TPA: hypothetical protein VLE27_02620 [Thermoanaerobaculia bacterium]|nr:hypothetical protein [Thermoanaerobaculia bacterium]
MKKHIVTPATAEQILRTLGATKEDLEVVERVMREVEAEDEEFFSSPCPKTEPDGPRYRFSKKDS